MAKRKTESTKYPGIRKVAGEKNLFEVRVKTKEMKTGRQREALELFEGTLDAAVERRLEVKRELQYGPAKERRPETVIELTERFVELRSPTWKKRSTRDFMSFVLGHLVDEIGDMSVGLVEPQDVQRCVAKLRGKDGGPATTSTYNNYLKRYRSVFEFGVKAGYLTRNPAHPLICRAPRGRDSRKSIALTAKQCRVLIETAGKYDAYLNELSGAPYMGHQTFIVLALATGCRRGELAALDWGKVNLADCWVDVLVTHYLGVIDKTKTEREDRLFLPKEVTRQLGSHWGTLQARGNKKQVESGLVFPSRSGGLSVNRLAAALPWCCERAGLPRLTTHDLRHTATTLWNKVATRRVTMKVIGHEDERTHQLYDHPDEEDIREGGEKVAELLGLKAS